MKKTIASSLAVLFMFGCINFGCISEASNYTNAKYKYNSYFRTIKTNNRKINSVKHSKNLSEYEKRRQIRKLERENYYIKRKQDNMKREYSRIFS